MPIGHSGQCELNREIEQRKSHGQSQTLEGVFKVNSTSAGVKWGRRPLHPWSIYSPSSYLLQPPEAILACFTYPRPIFRPPLTKSFFVVAKTKSPCEPDRWRKKQINWKLLARKDECKVAEIPQICSSSSVALVSLWCLLLAHEFQFAAVLASCFSLSVFQLR
jgi:hypothetical protein